LIFFPQIFADEKFPADFRRRNTADFRGWKIKLLYGISALISGIKSYYISGINNQ
jgi:hypothetical protein